MTLKEAIDSYKPVKARATRVTRPQEVITKKITELFTKIKKLYETPPFKDLKLHPYGAFGEFAEDLTPYCNIEPDSITIDKKKKVVSFNAHESWAYGGYAEGTITIPLKNIELTDEQMFDKAVDFAIKYYKNEIKGYRTNIKYDKERIQRCQQRIEGIRRYKER